MGEVYEAVDRHLDRTVAVKCLRPRFGTDPRVVARFGREARIAAALSHPGIVSVFDVGRCERGMFIVMEFVPGTTLAEVSTATSPLRASDVAAVGAQVATALAHAHARGVVHRDISPRNVMITQHSRIKVLDFGIAGAARLSGVAAASAHGTVPYAAPEVLAGGPVDHRADLYSLGVMLRELLARLPEGEIPTRLAALVASCCERDPSRRPSGASVVASSLWPMASRPEYPFAEQRPTRAVTAPLEVRSVTPELKPARPTGPGAGRGGISRLLVRFATALSLATMLLGIAMMGVDLLRSSTLPIPVIATGPDPLVAPGHLSGFATCDGWLSAGTNLTWTVSGSPQGIQIWRRGLSSEAWDHVTTVGGARTAYRDKDLGVGTGYSYRLRAIEGPRVSHWSETIHVGTPFLCLT
jgi:hypothetical protein